MDRPTLVQQLKAWQSGELGELAIWEWACTSRDETKEEAQDKAQTGGDDELVRDILDLLAALPYEMVIVDDLPVFLDALANPLDETDLSINLLWNHMDAVSVDVRRMQLADHPFYGQFRDSD